jgi:hypothetical protein
LSRNISRILILAVAALMVVTIVMVTAGPALAQVPPHRHLLTTGTGEEHEIALGTACAANPGFSNVHTNVHLGEPGTDVFENPNNPVSIRPVFDC